MIIGAACLHFHGYWLVETFVVLEYFYSGLQCVGHSFAYVTHLVFLRDVWIRTQRATVASRRATNLATHLPG
jgi:hypothetical protein